MKHIETQQKILQTRGFTLIEMLVSLSLFAVVVTMSVSMLLVLIESNGRAQSMQLVMTNLSFALDSITREIRTGTDWYCGSSASEPPIQNEGVNNDCVLGTPNYISITESGDSLTEGYGTRRVTYWFDSGYYNGEGGAILRKLGGPTGTAGDWVPLTGKDIDIEDFQIRVSGTDRWESTGGDTEQPRMTLYIRGRAGLGGRQEKEFSLQTSITQRTIDT